MRKHEFYQEYSDTFEYLGQTEIMRIRRKGNRTIRRDWIIFESTREALSHFEDKCGEHLGYYVGSNMS